MRHKARTFLVKISIFIVVFIGLIFFGILLQAAEKTTPTIVATVDTQKIVQKIDKRIYSQFLEHIYNSCNGGLWGELVWNRSFEAGKFSGWSFQSGILKQDSLETDCRYILGSNQKDSTSWTDYDIRVRAKKVAGSEGFLIMFRVSPDCSSYYWLNIGGWNNKYLAIEKETPSSNGRHIVGGQVEIPPIECERDYDIRILLMGRNIKVFIDQELVHEIVDYDDDAPKSGCIGVGTWATKVEFNEIVVRNLQRKTLFDLTNSELHINKTPDVRYWNVSGNVESRTGDAKNSFRYLRFFGEGGLSQCNYSFEESETYEYSFWARGEGVTSFCISLDESETNKCVESLVSIDSECWNKLTGTFTVPRSSTKSKLYLKFEPRKDSHLDIDQISIFPQSWKERTGGLRPDLLKAISDLQPTLIRWPGGCYASAYRWKSGIGSQDDRVAYPIELWDDVDPNSFGTDEFINLCRRSGADPIVVVNIGTSQWINAVGSPELHANDWLQEICDWVEYCNGDVSTHWGSIRAKNGHPEPYHVKYWEIDNEVRASDTPSSRYVQIINELVPRMKAIDPTIKIIACGSWTGNRMKWDREIIYGTGKNIDFLSTHRYDDPQGFAFNPWDNQRFFESRKGIIENSDNPNIKIFNSEWNAQSTDWRTGLHAGGFLNCCERVADIVCITSPALFLRHKTATAWDNALINFDNSSWFPAPNYVVIKLWRESFAPNLVKIISDTPELKGNNPLINIVATKSESGESTYLKIVNNKDVAVNFVITFDNTIDLKNSHIQAKIITPELNDQETAKDKLTKRNTFDAPNTIVPRKLSTNVVDGRLSFQADSYSVLAVKIEKK